MAGRRARAVSYRGCRSRGVNLFAHSRMRREAGISKRPPDQSKRLMNVKEAAPDRRICSVVRNYRADHKRLAHVPRDGRFSQLTHLRRIRMKYATLSTLLVLMLSLSACGSGGGEPDGSRDAHINQGGAGSTGTTGMGGSSQHVPGYSGNREDTGDTDVSGSPRY